MRLKVIPVCLILLFLPQLTLAADAAPKTKCSKVGQIAVVGKEKYRCIKMNRIFKWEKISQSKIAQPVLPTPTPTPTPTPSPSPTPSSTVDPVLLTVADSLNKMIPLGNLENVSTSEIGQIIVEPGIDEGNISETVRILKQIYLAQDVFKLRDRPVVILATTIAFIQSEFPKYCSQNISWFPNSTTSMERWESWAFVGCLYNRPVQVVPMPKSGLAVDHIEGAIGSDLGYLPIGNGPNTSKLPTWFVRGLKGVVGEYAVSIGRPEWQLPKMGLWNCSKVALKDLSYSYEDVTSNHCDTPLGQTASRYMVSMKGLLPTLVFMNELQRTGVWSEEIFSTFLGMPFAQFEEEAKSYGLKLDKYRAIK